MVMQNRVYGVLAISRAFGDREFKRTTEELTGRSNSGESIAQWVTDAAVDEHNATDDRVCSYTIDPKYELQTPPSPTVTFAGRQRRQ